MNDVTNSQSCVTLFANPEEGLIGDRLLIITQGSTGAPVTKEGQHLVSAEPVEIDAIMASLQVTAGNAAIISEQLSEIMMNINSGNGTLGRLISDSAIAKDFSVTMSNIRSSTKGLDENMNAAKENFLLKGYFNRKVKEAEEAKKDSADRKAAEKKAIDKENRKKKRY